MFEQVRAKVIETLSHFRDPVRQIGPWDNGHLRTQTIGQILHLLMFAADPLGQLTCIHGCLLSTLTADWRSACP